MATKKEKEQAKKKKVAQRTKNTAGAKRGGSKKGRGRYPKPMGR